MGAAASDSGFPQLPQKVLSAGTVAPQLPHFISEPGKCSPHLPQYLAPGLFLVLHLGHST